MQDVGKPFQAWVHREVGLLVKPRVDSEVEDGVGQDARHAEEPKRQEGPEPHLKLGVAQEDSGAVAQLVRAFA